jgi:hypothetical protein
MTLSGRLLAGALALGLATPVAASPAFDAFRHVCGDTRADFTAVKAAVSAGGWIPTEVQPSTMEGVTVIESLARTAMAGDARITVYAWHGTKGKIEVSVCTMRVTGPKYAVLDGEAKAWVGFAPQTATDEKSSFQFTDAGGARKALDKTGYDAAAAGAGLEMFTVTADGQQTIIDLLKIKS